MCDTIKAKDGVDWYFIKYNNKFGFINSKQVLKEATTVSYCYVKKTTSKIRYTAAGRAYFMGRGSRQYLDEFIKVN